MFRSRWIFWADSSRKKANAWGPVDVFGVGEPREALEGREAGVTVGNS